MRFTQITFYVFLLTFGALASYAWQAPKVECAYHEGYNEGWRDSEDGQSKMVRP